MTGSTRETARTLFSLAMEQSGYFTAKQALAAGYAYPSLEYHVSTGSFERVDHGLYRLASLPVGEHDDLVRLSLWSRNQKGEPQAVVSHESALVHFDLTELLPGAVHLTVPPKFRKAPPPGCVIHKASLSPMDTEERAGFRVTTPLRTLLDVAVDGISREQLEKAVDETLTRGLVRRTQLIEAVRKDPRFGRLSEILGDGGPARF
jgi:predicted transcriptional regulator of viral defense system